MKKFWEKLKEKFSSDNIDDTWKKVRNTSLVVNIVGGTVLAILAPFTIPAVVTNIISGIVVVSGTIAGRAQYNTGKLKQNKPTVQK